MRIERKASRRPASRSRHRESASRVGIESTGTVHVYVGAADVSTATVRER